MRHDKKQISARKFLRICESKQSVAVAAYYDQNNHKSLNLRRSPVAYVCGDYLYLLKFPKRASTNRITFVPMRYKIKSASYFQDAICCFKQI